MKPEQWIVNGEVGTSSKTIWAVMQDAVIKDSPRAGWDYGVPHDPDDFSRCWKLLILFPQWRRRLSEVAQVFPSWIGFIREWDKLEKMYLKNLTDKPEGFGYSKEMYNLMQQLEDEGRLADGWVQTAPGSWQRSKS